MVPVENNFLEVNCHQFPGARFDFISCYIDHLLSDHLSSCQLCCCIPFQFEDHKWVLHHDVEDHWEEEDEVGTSRSFVKYSSLCVLGQSRYPRISGSSLSFNRVLSFVGICTIFKSCRDCFRISINAVFASWYAVFSLNVWPILVHTS